MTDLTQRLRELAEALEGCEWELPLCSRETCVQAVEEIERMRRSGQGPLERQVGALIQQCQQLEMDREYNAELVRERDAEIERLTKLNEDKFRHLEAYCKAAAEDKAKVDRLQSLADYLAESERECRTLLHEAVEAYDDCVWGPCLSGYQEQLPRVREWVKRAREAVGGE